MVNYRNKDPMASHQDRMRFLRTSGLMPNQSDNLYVDNSPQYRDSYIKPKPMMIDNQLLENPTRFGVVDPAKVATPLVDAKKKIKKKKTSIDGENIIDITNNIIKDKPPIKLVIKAFQKMADMIADQKDEEFLADLK